MDLSSILNNTQKKNGNSKGDSEFSNYSSPSPSPVTPTPTPSTSRSNSIEKQYLAKDGDSSSVELTDVSYNYYEDQLSVQLSFGRLDNLSSWRTGDLRVYCWISENRYNFDDGFGNDNVFCVGMQDIGHLDSGYGFSDLKFTFEVPDDIKTIDSRWHFVFTINEYNTDDEWYIVDYRNGECELTSNDYGTIVAIICDKLGVEEDDVTYNASFANDLGADSLDSVELIMEFEKEFGMTVPDEDAEDISTVGELVTYIKNVL